MSVNTTLPLEGDAFDATDLNGQFTSVETAVNAIEVGDIQREALRRDHLPSTVDARFTGSTTRGQLQAVSDPSPSDDVYNSALTINYTASPDNWQPSWSQFGSNASTGIGSAAAPYGPYTGTEVGWRIPATRGDINWAAECRLDPAWGPGSAINGAGVDLLLCKFGVNVRGSTEQLDEQDATIVEAHEGTLWLAVGWEDNLGTRYIVERSIRAFPVEAVVRGNASIFGTVRGEDIPAGRTLVAVFGAINSQQLWCNESAQQTSQGTGVIINYYDFSYEPVRGEERT